MSRRIDIKDIKKDQHFWERDQEFVATEDGHPIGKITVMGKECEQWQVEAKHLRSGSVCPFMTTETAEHYGPKLYSEQAYI